MTDLADESTGNLFVPYEIKTKTSVN